MLNKLKIHLFFLTLMVLIITYGVIFNSGAVGWFLGGIISLAKDPIIIVFAIAVGLYFNNTKHLFFAYIVSTILVNIIVSLETTRWVVDLGLNPKDAISLDILFIRSVTLLYETIFFNSIRVISQKII